MTFMCTILEAKKGQPVNLNQTTDSKKLAAKRKLYFKHNDDLCKIFQSNHIQIEYGRDVSRFNYSIL